MSWITYFLIFLAICVVWFLITRIWVSGIDLMISALKKIFRGNKHDSLGNWRSLEEIRDQKKKDSLNK